MRTYLQLFGGLAPLDVQKRARGGRRRAALRHVGRLRVGAGLARLPLRHPAADADQRAHGGDVRAPRRRALRPRARARSASAEGRRAAAGASASSSRSSCRQGAGSTWQPSAPRFDVLHRTFLGYPAPLAPAAAHGALLPAVPRHRRLGTPRPTPKSRFSPGGGRLGRRLLRPRPPPRVSPVLRGRMKTTRRRSSRCSRAARRGVRGPAPWRRWPTSREGERDRVLHLHHRGGRLGRDPLGRSAQRGCRGIIHPASTENTDTSQLQALGRRAARRTGSRASSSSGPRAPASSSAPAPAIWSTSPTASPSSTASR